MEESAARNQRKEECLVTEVLDESSVSYSSWHQDILTDQSQDEYDSGHSERLRKPLIVDQSQEAGGHPDFCDEKRKHEG